MYHFPNQQLQLYHHNHYQQCPINIEDTKLQNLNSLSEAQYHQVYPQNIESSALLHVENTIEPPPLQPEVTESVKKKKTASKKTRAQVVKGEVSKKPVKKPAVDTSNFSIEERLVAAVWVHERKYTSNTISEVILSWSNILLNLSSKFQDHPLHVSGGVLFCKYLIMLQVLCSKKQQMIRGLNKKSEKVCLDFYEHQQIQGLSKSS